MSVAGTPKSINFPRGAVQGGGLPVRDALHGDGGRLPADGAPHPASGGRQGRCARHVRAHRLLRQLRAERQEQVLGLDDVGRYDMPALLSLTRRLTGNPRVFFVGVSAGGNAFYTWLELVPRMRSVVRAAYLMAPGVLFTQRHSQLLKAIALFPDKAISDFGKNADEMLGRPPGFVRLAWQMCRPDSPMRSTCESLVEIVTGLNPSRSDFSRLEFFVAHSLCGTSTTALAHYAQNIKTGKFQAYDWGREENLRRYGREVPPEYRLQNVSTPIAVFVGKNDRFVSYQDALTLSRVTSKNIGMFLMPPEEFDHFDFIGNKEAHRYAYEKIIGLMNEHEDSEEQQ
ncbi:lipase 3-like isoform X3 [Schistocerca gregaria]|uniref:lipase 3-like isoform X3 n=1 Tax=Schistocerca gregaria TaxID=7010 RepID=UPI00211E602B|nr:lipase 3-like isoform X3 [Schistocerca gregaria]